MKRIFSEKYKGAMLAAAIGDALGGLMNKIAII